VRPGRRPAAVHGSAARALARELEERGGVDLAWFASYLSMNRGSYSETCKILPRKARGRHVFEVIARRIAEELQREGSARVEGGRVLRVGGAP
jgi:hypothetical protein